VKPSSHRKGGGAFKKTKQKTGRPQTHINKATRAGEGAGSGVLKEKSEGWVKQWGAGKIGLTRRKGGRSKLEQTKKTTPVLQIKEVKWESKKNRCFKEEEQWGGPCR